jgi:hypothetical protein
MAVHKSCAAASSSVIDSIGCAIVCAPAEDLDGVAAIRTGGAHDVGAAGVEGAATRGAEFGVPASDAADRRRWRERRGRDVSFEAECRLDFHRSCICGPYKTKLGISASLPDFWLGRHLIRSR